jgi:hypothetical protein
MVQFWDRPYLWTIRSRLLNSINAWRPKRSKNIMFPFSQPLHQAKRQLSGQRAGDRGQIDPKGVGKN